MTAHEHVWESALSDTHDRCSCGDTEPKGITIFRSQEPTPDKPPLPVIRTGDTLTIVTNRGTWTGLIGDPAPDGKRPAYGEFTGRVRPEPHPDTTTEVTGL